MAIWGLEPKGLVHAQVMELLFSVFCDTFPNLLNTGAGGLWDPLVATFGAAVAWWGLGD